MNYRFRYFQQLNLEPEQERLIKQLFSNRTHYLRLETDLTALLTELIKRIESETSDKSYAVRSELKQLTGSLISIFQTNIALATRTRFLTLLLNSAHTYKNESRQDLMLWIRLIVEDYDHYIHYNQTWNEIIKLALAPHCNNQQKAISEFTAAQFHKHFLSIPNAARKTLLALLLQNKALQKYVLRILSKHFLLLPSKLRESILLDLITIKSIPDRYFQSYQKRYSLSDLVNHKINERLQS